MEGMLIMKCPNCHTEKNVIGYGQRQTRKGIVRRYHCKRCRITFSDSTSPHTQYPENVILHTIEQYNRGYPVTVARKMTGKKYQYSPPISTIYAWIKRYEDILTFTKLRRKYHLDPDQLITVHKLDHGQIYPFKYHNLKLNIHSKGRPELRRYINWVERSLDRSMFLKGPRASSLRIDREAVIKEVDSRLPEMTRMALNSKPRNSKLSPHEMVESFFLINDSSTVTTELPVFLYPRETDLKIEDALSGHIDLIQVRYGTLHILDYKPDLNQPKKYIDQLTLYRDALQKRTSIPKEKIKIEIFNQYSHYEIIQK